MKDYSNLTPAEIIDLYKTTDLEQLEMSKIRKDLSEGGVSDDDIAIVQRILGNEKIKNLHRAENQRQGSALMRGGFIISGLSLVLTLALWRTGWIWFGAIFGIVAGLGMVLLGLNKNSS